MSWKVTDLRGDDVLARDGAIGTLDDVYFDDERWAVRYMVVDTGGWVAGRRMLVSPQAVEAGISDPGKLRIGATREQLREAPGAQEDMPVAEQQRIAQARGFGPPYYWSNPVLWGEDAPVARPAHEKREADPHLRSSSEVIGYEVHALDGDLGRVDDFVIDEHDWKVSGVVVDTKSWWPGGRVRVAPEHIDHIDWAERKVHVRLSRDELKAAGA